MGNSLCSKEQNTTAEEKEFTKTGVLLGNRYRVQETVIGKGSFAIVKLGYDTKTKKKVAVRVMPTAGICPVSLEHLHREAEIHPTLDHPSIVKCAWCREDEHAITMVQEYVPDGSLLDYYAKKRVLMEFEVRAIFTQLVAAVSYMHSVGVVHRDIKADNILIYASTQTIKLADMGFADRFTEDKLFRNFPGTLAYSPPEVLLGKPHYGPARDVWSCGVLLYILLTGKYPFGSQATVKTKNRIINDEPDYTSPKISGTAKDLLQRLLTKDPAQRVTLREVEAHPWIHGGSLFKNSVIRRASSTIGDLLPAERKDLPKVAGQEKVNSPRRGSDDGPSPPQSPRAAEPESPQPEAKAEGANAIIEPISANGASGVSPKASEQSSSGTESVSRKEKERILDDGASNSPAEARPQPLHAEAITA